MHLFTAAGARFKKLLHCKFLSNLNFKRRRERRERLCVCTEKSTHSKCSVRHFSHSHSSSLHGITGYNRSAVTPFPKSSRRMPQNLFSFCAFHTNTVFFLCPTALFAAGHHNLSFHFTLSLSLSLPHKFPFPFASSFLTSIISFFPSIHTHTQKKRKEKRVSFSSLLFSSELSQLKIVFPFFQCLKGLNWSLSTSRNKADETSYGKRPPPSKGGAQVYCPSTTPPSFLPPC